jgi:hypothetical protein
VLAQAEQELLSAKMIRIKDNLSVQQLAVRRAKHALEEAEAKLRAVKRWNRDFDTNAEPLTKRLESLREFLSHDMPKGISFLLQAQRTLEEYSETRRVESSGKPPESQPAAAADGGNAAVPDQPNA